MAPAISDLILHFCYIFVYPLVWRGTLLGSNFHPNNGQIHVKKYVYKQIEFPCPAGFRIGFAVFWMKFYSVAGFVGRGGGFGGSRGSDGVQWKLLKSQKVVFGNPLWRPLRRTSMGPSMRTLSGSCSTHRRLLLQTFYGGLLWALLLGLLWGPSLEGLLLGTLCGNFYGAFYEVLSRAASWFLLLELKSQKSQRAACSLALSMWEPQILKLPPKGSLWGHLEIIGGDD